MDDLDRLLNVMENPTRRRILEALVREPHYPLRLSKALGISQQAVSKNLSIMEREGIIVSYRESSSQGPDRTIYEPNMEFTIVMDMRSGMFRTNLFLPASGGDGAEGETEGRGLEEAREAISGIDGELREIERRRLELVEERGRLISSVMSRAPYGYRNLMYEMLDRPDDTPEEISARLDADEDDIRHMMADAKNASR